MLTDSNQIFRNCFVIIYYHLTKVSSEINKCIIFEANELSIRTLYGTMTMTFFFNFKRDISTFWKYKYFWATRNKSKP